MTGGAGDGHPVPTGHVDFRWTELKIDIVDGILQENGRMMTL
jgi:hypothetical protein